MLAGLLVKGWRGTYGARGCSRGVYVHCELYVLSQGSTIFAGL